MRTRVLRGESLKDGISPDLAISYALLRPMERYSATSSTVAVGPGL
jgi:hypothetical protein